MWVKVHETCSQRPFRSNCNNGLPTYDLQHGWTPAIDVANLMPCYRCMPPADSFLAVVVQAIATQVSIRGGQRRKGRLWVSCSSTFTAQANLSPSAMTVPIRHDCPHPP